ncbi:unnamed protein product [Prunus armeniaca]|uniref:Uncharacterized protein n=1 Tax=Prunus armeniaca TaxID=36596 RepID=A0A6J5WPD5_PRUAR|nr:unnamed protein product [Prunus armeniaca]
MLARASSWARMHVGTGASGRRWRYRGCAVVAGVGEENTRSAAEEKKRVGITRARIGLVEEASSARERGTERERQTESERLRERERKRERREREWNREGEMEMGRDGEDDDLERWRRLDSVVDRRQFF